jgi:membrane protease YdiL (CAAX protease family)
MSPGRLAEQFGAAAPDARGAEWRRLGLFLAFGTAFFLFAIVGAAFVPLGWPDAIRRSAHPAIFVPLAVALTVRMLRRDARELTPEVLFDPWPVGRMSLPWLLLGSALAGAVALTFALAFGLRWAPNLRWSGASAALMLWAIVLTAAAEELAFRGYGLWRLMRLVGFWPAQAIVAALFVVSHLTLGGSALLPALVGNVTGSVLYGVAFARTRGIAAPIALHSGWNIAQHLLLSPLDPSATPLVPTFPHVATGREYAAMLAIVGIVMAATAAAILKGRGVGRSSGVAG